MNDFPYPHLFDSVAPKLTEQLRTFRHSHRVSVLEIEGVPWKYYRAGSGPETVLLLVGSLCDAEIWFQYIAGLEDEYTVLAPSYPAIPMLEALVRGVDRICEAENLKPDHVVGQSFGGMLAQAWMRRHGEGVKSLALCHTSAPAAPLQAVLWKVYGRNLPLKVGAFRSLPWPILRFFALRNITYNLSPEVNPGWARFWQAFFAESMRTKVGKEHLAAITGHCIPEFFRTADYGAGPKDRGYRVLLVEALKDTLMGAVDREATRLVYSKATAYTFPDGGHLSLLARPEEGIPLLRHFLATSK